MVRCSGGSTWAKETLTNPAYTAEARVVAPAAGSELCITTGVVAGTYIIYAVLCPADTPAPGALIQLELRNGGDTVTLDIYAATAAPTAMIVQTRIKPLTVGLKVRAINGTAGAAGSVYFVRIDVVAVP